MEILASKIAELLDITVEQSVALYPILKEQFVWYRAYESVGSVISILITISIVGILLTGLAYAVNFEDRIYEDTDQIEKYNTYLSSKRLFHSNLIIIGIAFVVGVILDVIVVLKAPDIMIIQSIIEKM